MPELTLALDPSKDLKTKQLRALLASVAQTVSQICSASEECGVRLDQIEEEMEEAEGIEGIRVLRFRLEESLQSLRNETRRQRQELSQIFARLQKQVETAQAADRDEKRPGAEIDRISGFETRETAERVMASTIQRGGGSSYATLFVVDRLHLINAQFGYSTGDRILREVGEHLRSCLSPADQLFRWTGPAFLAVIERGEEPVEVEASIQRLAAERLETTVKIGNGSVRLPVMRTSMLAPLAGCQSLGALKIRLDAFTGQQARH